MSPALEDVRPAKHQRLRLLTYNIHGGIGIDGRYDLERIAAVLGEEAPDIVALQELECGVARSRFHNQAVEIGERLGMSSTFCATRAAGQGRAGLAILSRYHALGTQHYDLTYKTRREPRSCLRVDLQMELGTQLHVFNCHLGLATQERLFQRRRMLSDAILLSEELHHPVVIMGDFNDKPVSVVHGELRRHFVDAFTAAGREDATTFQFGLLRLRLDHIYVSSAVRVLDCRVRRSGHARVASDHRPLFACVEIDSQTSAASSG